MTNQQILKSSLSITSSKVSLWVLGIFLSSGFNLHWLYGIAWLKRSGLLSEPVRYVLTLNPLVLVPALFVIYVVGLLLFNLVKLIFLVQVHDSIHFETEEKCLLCVFRKKYPKFIDAIFRPAIIWRTCLASFITIGLTTALFSTFNLYLVHSEPNMISQIVLLLSLVIILILVALWNLAVVLFILFYELSFAKATSLASELLMVNFKRIFGFTFILLVIFVFAVTAGSLVISQIPTVIGTTPALLLQNQFQPAWYWLVSGGSLLILLLWLVVNNVFFNLNLITLFDSLIRLKRNTEPAIMPSIAPINPTATQHSTFEQ